MASMLASAPLGKADDRPLSLAQVALFESNHLKDIAKPVMPEYPFRHHGSVGDFVDKITANIRAIHETARRTCGSIF